MKYLFSRFGGPMFIVGKGRASDERLPKDQSLDYLLDHYATEIKEKVFFISSYDARPEFMGSYQKLPPNTVKIGTLVHDFNELFMQHDVKVTTDIYVTIHGYSNVYALLIKTYGQELKWSMGEYEPTYDYVQTTFFRDIASDDLKESPKLMEIMLLILFYKMEIHLSTFIFTPSKTFLGKRISCFFLENVNALLGNVESDDDLKQLLKRL